MTMNIEQRTHAAVEKIEVSADKIKTYSTDLENRGEAALASIGGKFIGEYAANIQFTDRYDYVIQANQAYKVKLSTALPFATTGNFINDQQSLEVYDNAAEAKQAEVNAKQSEINAESSANAAAASANIYLNVATGIAVTTNGQLFLVVGEGTDSFSDLYLNDNGAGVFQGKSTLNAQITPERKYAPVVSPILNIIDGVALSAFGGTTNDVNYETTDFIPVQIESRVTITTGMGYTFARQVIGYDIQKNFVKEVAGQGHGLQNAKFELDANIAFIRICNLKSKGVSITCQVEDNIRADMYKQLSGNTSKLVDITLTNNIKDGKWVSQIGSINSDARLEISSFDVLGYEEVRVSSATVAGAYPNVVFYDKDGLFLSYIQPSPSGSTWLDYQVSVPVNAIKMIVNNYKGHNVTISVKRQRTSAALASAQDLINTNKSLSKDFEEFYKKGDGIPSYNITQETVGFIVAGQSNTDGRCPNSEFPTTWVEDGQTYSYSKNLSNVKVNYNKNSGVFSNMNVSGLWAFDSIVQNKVSQLLGGANFYTVKRSEGGTAIKFNPNINNWCADIELFNSAPASTLSLLYELQLAIINAREANPYIKFKAILWHQGEADAGSPVYYRDLGRVIAYIRGVAKNPTLSFIFGNISTTSESYNEVTNDAFNRVASEIPYTYLVDMRDKTLLDKWHFDSVSAEYLGDQMYQILKTNNLLKRGV